ncbi:MAG: lysylphosphatidylglycerol synthase transmembrane domain-containing protein [Bacteroidia bacterium]
MNSKVFQAFQYLLLLALGILLCYAFFHTLDIEGLKAKLNHGNYSWFAVVMFVSLLVYVFRTLRWQMLIRSTGHQSKFINAFSALSISYLVSFVVPRLGEITRCLSVKKQHDIPFMSLLGTVIIERVIDILSLAILLLITAFVQFSQIMEFMKENVFHPFMKLIGGNILVLAVLLTLALGGLILFYAFRKKIVQRSPKFILKFLEGLKEGLLSIANLKQKWLFIMYTLLIWIGYYLMTWFWFFVFPETSVLSAGACLSILAIGTVGRSVPIQGGGMGAYHFLVTGVVMLYGLSEEWGKTLATLIHAGQTFFTFAMGIIGLLIFFGAYWKRKTD